MKKICKIFLQALYENPLKESNERSSEEITGSISAAPTRETFTILEETVTRTPVGISGAYNIHTKIKFLQDVSFRYSQKNYIE